MDLWTRCLFVSLAGCVVGDALPPDRSSLKPVVELTEPDYVARSRPKHLALSPDGALLFASLEGDLVTPGSQVLALDATSGTVLAAITVGSSPQGIAFSSDGTKLYVTNQFSNFLSVIDVATLAVIGEIGVSFYAEDVAVAPDATALYLANRWRDAVEIVKLGADGTSATGETRVPVAAGANPRNVVIGPGGLLYVANLSATSVSVVDPSTATEVDRLYTNSPVNGVASDGRYVYVATLGRGDGHGKLPGMSPNGVGYRGDGTASTGFSDINNDVLVLGQAQGKLAPLFRYTSDTAEVSTRDAKGDYTPGEMIVAGALPEQVTVHGDRLYVTMSASDQVQVFDIHADGSLASRAIYDTGINPFGIAVSADDATIYTADRLGETISKIDAATGTRQTWNVGAHPEQPYPASEYETGEMLFHSSKFSSEALPSAVFPNGDKAGDKSCNHCHRETLTDGKVWTVGIDRVVPLGGERMPPAARNIHDTVLLFWEGVQTKGDFDLESNEFSPPEDFGCDRAMTEANPDTCAARDAFFMKQTGHTFRQVATHLIGEFLVGRQRLLPNPNHQFPTALMAASIARGLALFQSPEVRCSQCHPVGPFTTNLTIPEVITGTWFDNALMFKTRQPGTFNVPSLRGIFDRPSVFTHDGRAKSIRSAILSPGHPALANEVDGCQHLDDNIDQFQNGIVQPVHNGRGCNELHGVHDVHGTTSQLTPDQVDDLVNFVLSIE